MNAHIYVLIDTRDNTVFYVGKTTQPLKLRLRQHIDTSLRKGKNARTHRIRELRQQGYTPAIQLLETVPETKWRDAEHKWVKHYLDQGVVLTNVMCQVGNGGTRSYILDWTPGIIARFGKESDAVIAADLGVSRKAVTYQRWVRGIAPYTGRGNSPPPPPGRKFQAKVLPEWVIEQLGQKPDYVLAQEAGVSKSAIAARRRERGIAPYAEQTGQTGKFGADHTKPWTELTPEIIEQLGKVPDRVLAAQANVGIDIIRGRRYQLGIVPYARSRPKTK